MDQNKLIDKSEIYMVTNIITGQKYIGQGKCYYKRPDGRLSYLGSKTRFSCHVSYANRDIKGRGAQLLMESIKRYGEHNHCVKPIFICPTTQANYYEVKFIRQYKTQFPNGMNIMRGGKKCPLTEAIKKKMSERKQGMYSGEKNPMYGKKHSDEALEKMRQSQIGKVLPQSVKENMSKAHNARMQNGQLPPRRKHNDLPKYVYNVTSSNKEGYEIRHHPTLKSRQFVANSKSMQEKLQQSVEYLADIDNPNNKKVELELDEDKYKNLPRFVRLVKSEKFQGFEVKCHPKLSNKKWTSMKYTMDEKLNFAKQYLEECSETKRLSVV
jgi:hypothetical protein